MRGGTWLGGVRLPRPRYVPLDDPRVIVKWMRSVLQDGGTPHLVTFASPAVRICQTALEAGVDLAGAQFTVGGEPFTPRRLATIQAAGAVAVPRYASVECGAIGVGCVQPDAADSVHVVSDLLAMIQAGPGGPLPSRALLITALSATAPLRLLNVSLGDQAIVAGHPCGCVLERLGWEMRLHTIRSFEKLTAGGMTFHDADVVPILEEILPARFGGMPADYQIVETEGEAGQPIVTVLAHPRLGPLDPAALVDAFLAALDDGSGPGRVLSLQWRAAGVVRMERTAPRPTESGKLLYVRRPGGSTVQ